MSIYRELAYDRVISGVRGIQFCVLSEQDIRRRSAVEVKENQTFAGNEPVPNGLFDTRMGVVDGSRVCATCQQRNTFCPGHFGHVVLARPVFYVQFFDVVRKLMKCVCVRCSRVLVDLDGPEARKVLGRRISRQKRWEAMSKLCQKVRRCGQDTVDGCGAKVPDKVTKTDDMRLKLTWRDAGNASAAAGGEDEAGPSSGGQPQPRETVFNAEDVLRVLRRVSDLDCEALGFSAEHNRPERMICTVLPVPPPSVRPSVRHETGQRQEDDLTHKLSDIVKVNNVIRDRIAGGATFDAVESTHVPLLQYHVATLIDNSMPSMYPSKDRAGRTFRSLTERLKHKEGRIRGNLMGKRVDFSARTVITPDPNLSIDEHGVPLKIAMNLTFPEIVRPGNRAELQRLVLAGPDVYPGAKQVRKAAEGNRTIRLRGHPDPASIVLVDGDVVERHLRNGDYVLFNRQPSLHKMSMMAHRVRVMPYHTFRLNVCVCASYNADFDGDEMNMHVPQSLQTHYELKELAAVPLHVLSPRYSKPIITIVQDIALGVFRITQPHVRVTQRQLFNLACGNQLLGGFVAPNAVASAALGGADVAPPGSSGLDIWSAGGEGPTRTWTGRQVLSTVLPPTASVGMKTLGDKQQSDYVPDVHDVRIEGGVILSGVLNEKVFSKASVGLVHSTYNTLGPSAVTAMLNSTQKLICDWLVHSGFSVGVSDLVISPETSAKKRVGIDAAKRGVLELLRSLHAGTFENDSTKSDAAMLEDKIKGVLDKASDAARLLCRAGFDIGNNRMLNMIESGSKGKPVNFQQMTACLGPQSIEGQRVPDGFDGRTLPHFTKYDDGPEARGFVEHSFIEGLTPHEFFFHSMAGRIGLIDTAVRSVTWETPVLVVEAGRPKRVLIGEWIDGLLAVDAGRDVKAVKRYPEDRDMELLELDREVLIPTADAEGNVSWGKLTAVTRHDPGERLYRVKTAGGRETTVAESNSLLVWKPASATFEPTHSAEVKVGDFLPVTARLPEPPVVTGHVNMSEYLSKKDHIYGTDFNTARRMVDEAQGGRFRIPLGWWAAHNGVEFDLPYTKKALLTRACSGRSNVDNVAEGRVYPYHATRCHGSMPERCEGGCGDEEEDAGDVSQAEIDMFDSIPDRFELTHDNGTFIGIFLADGHTCVDSGVVGITKVDVGIQQYAKGWFEKQGFSTRLQDNTDERGRSHTMFGHSVLLARFLNAFVGKGSANKFVPEVAYVAPIEFVRGILSGYFSGDGSISSSSITSSTISARLNEGIAALCTRVGAFAKASVKLEDREKRADASTIYHLSIRAQWGRVLADQLTLIHSDKVVQLKDARFTAVHPNYTAQNDVVLDSIVSIEVLGVEAHPKLYDVTVPSTLNYALANGMIGRDTSETGYLQRRLVKAMEDCKIHHDLTVRNANNFVVQFLYGEDGMDAIKLEYHKLPTLAKEPAELQDEFLLVDAGVELRGHVTDDVLKACGTSDADVAAWRARCTEHFRQLVEDRRGVIMGLHEGLQVDDKEIVYPVNVGRIVEQTAALHARAGGLGGPSDLEPTWVLDRIDELAAELRVGDRLEMGMPLPSSAHALGNPGIRWLPVLLRAFLSPKRLIRKHRLNRAAFARVVAEVRRDFWAAIAHPGEMTGIVAATSLGEPCTQLSVESGARLLMLRQGEAYSGPIGALLDRMLAEDASRVVDLGGGSVVLDPTEDIYVVGVSDEEKTSWRRVQQISRHPANGGMVRIHTDSGKTTCATLSHSFLKRTERGIAPVLGSELKVGDRVPVARSLPAAPEGLERSTFHIGPHDVPLTRDFGWLCGAYVADGNVSGNSVSIAKVIPEYQDELRRIYRDMFNLDVKLYTREAGQPGSNILHGWDMNRCGDVDNAIKLHGTCEQVCLTDLTTPFDDPRYPGAKTCVSSPPLAEFFLHNFNTGSHVKRLPPWVYAACPEFVSGLLCGYFDGDGNVNCDAGKQMMRTGSVSEKLTEDFVLLFARVGLFGSKCREKHDKEPGRNDIHTIQISRKHARAFRDRVGPLVVKTKADALDEVVKYAEREDRHSFQEIIDQIPELGDVIAAIGKTLELDGQSRLYGRWLKKEAIGRETLRAYIPVFEAGLDAKLARDAARHLERTQQLAALRAEHAAFMATLAAYHKDSKKRAADGGPLPNARAVLQLPEDLVLARALVGMGTELLGSGKLCGSANASGYAKSGRIQAVTLTQFLDRLEPASEARRVADVAAAADVRDDKLPVLRQALDADVVWDEIVALEVLADPGEMVYDLTVPGNDSFMVDCGILVHNTLNSVVHGTELMLREVPASLDVVLDQDAAKGGVLTRRAIGELIDGLLEGAEEGSARLERHPNDTSLLWLKDGGDTGPVASGIEVLATDEDGRVSWKEVTAVTRHPVVNKDGSDTLIEVETESGRIVTATKGKSFLTRRGNKLVPTDGEDLRVGDHLPVTRTLKLPPSDVVDFLDLDRYLPRTEFLYESELAKAIACSKLRRHWFQGKRPQDKIGNGHEFVVPHSRSDSLLECVRSNLAGAAQRQFRTGCVYPKMQGSKSHCHVPERLPLDELFGFYVGAYLAEGSEGNCQVGGEEADVILDSDSVLRSDLSGCSVDDQVHISNVDKDYQRRIVDFAERYDVGWHLQDRSDEKGQSEDICVHSKVIADLTIRMCGRGAPNKRLPPELIAANEEFLAGLVDGYFSGDGACSGESYTITTSSVSKGLLEDFANVLLRFDIGSKITVYHDPRVVTSKGTPILPCYTLRLRNGDALRFADRFMLTKMSKQAAVETMRNVVMTSPSFHTPEDVIPVLELPGSGASVSAIHRDCLPKLLASLTDAADRAAVEATLGEDVWYDKVVSIKDVPNPKGRYVYDLTVRDTRNFVIWNGMSVRDTFHLSGVSSGTNVTTGVPRMKELMSVSKNIKTPSMKIRLRREWATSQASTSAVLSTIETTHFRDLVSRSSVHFDPSDAETTVAEDEGLMRFFREFSAQQGDAKTSPWLLRFEFDRMKMLDLQVTMLDLEAALVDHFDDAISCVLSDDNAKDLVCRLRLSALEAAGLAEGADLLTEIKALEQAVMDHLVVKGVPRVDRAVPMKPSGGLKRYDPASDAFVPDDEWYIETAGSNLVDVMCSPCVDYTRTTTNDVHEVYLVLGVEAARQALIDEMRVVLRDTPIDHRHLALLADTMCNRGFFMSIDRHGINNRGELGPLAKCSFEQSVDMLVKAGMFSERDRINGVSANIMLGQVAPCGTGDCQVLMDNERLASLGKPVPLLAERGVKKVAPAANAQRTDADIDREEMPALEGPSNANNAEALPELAGVTSEGAEVPDAVDGGPAPQRVSGVRKKVVGAIKFT